MLSPGKFVARAISFQFGETPQAKEFVAVLYSVTFPNGESERITAYYHFATPENSEISTRQLMAAGWDGVSTNMRGLGSVDCEIVVVIEPFNGKPRTSVKYVNQLVAYVREPLDAARSRSFMDRVVKSRGSAGATAPTQWDGQGEDPDAGDPPDEHGATR